jgi:hypothetical protein
MEDVDIRFAVDFSRDLFRGSSAGVVSKSPTIRPEHPFASQSPVSGRVSGLPTIRPESADSLRTETSKNAFVDGDSYIPGILLPISCVSPTGYTNWDAETSEGPRESMSRAYCVSCSLPIAVRVLRT